MLETNKDSLSQLWKAVSDYVRENGGLSASAFGLWFEDMEMESLSSEEAVFSTSNDLKMKMVTERYSLVLSDALNEYIGFRPSVKITVREKEEDPSSYVIPRQETRSDDRRDSRGGRQGDHGTSQKRNDGEDTYNTDYSFENFIVGESNKFAHAAALAVAQNPGFTYNPLFIYGNSGLGKTHLMFAIANRIHANDPYAVVIYVKGDEFTNQLVESIANHSTASFREKYRKADVLMIDDIQFIAGKTSTQEEFFHTFNSLYTEHKQIIVTSDRPPKEMATLEDRIRSRFEAGLLADIGLPDYELRLAILRSKAESVNLRLPEEASVFLAEHLHSNIRQIEGVIHKLSARQFLNEQPITVEYVKAAVPEFLKDSEQTSDLVNRIISITARHYNVSEEDILGKSRQKDIKTARNVAMYVIRNNTDLSLSDIGVMLNRDHSTVHSNISVVESAIRTDTSLENDIQIIQREIKSV